MTRRRLAVLVAGAIAILPGIARAQVRTSLTVAGGLSAPVGTLGNQADAGFNLAGGLSFAAPLTPAGVRLELAYNGLNGKSGFVGNADTRIISGTVNATLALGPAGDSPYLIGGVGAYDRRYSAGGATSEGRTTGGFNVGGGFRFPLGSISTFVEARYHQMLGNAADGTNYRFVPVTFGINF